MVTGYWLLNHQSRIKNILDKLVNRLIGELKFNNRHYTNR